MRNIETVLNWRYSTKSFNTEKKISKEDFEKLKAILQLSPSSTNIQPWHFIIGHTEEGKRCIAKGAQGFFKFNESKIMSASHVVVFAARTDADESYMELLSTQEERDGRYPNAEIKKQVYQARKIFADIHRYDVKDFQHWLEKQVYLNMGNFLLGAAALEIDALPMEGVDLKALDEEFGLREKGFTSVGVVALGYRDKSDFNSTEKTPKSRLPKELIITELN